MSGYPPEPDPLSREGGESEFPTYPYAETGPSNYANPDPVAPSAAQGMQPSSGSQPPAIQGQPYGAFGARLRKSPYAVSSLILGILGTVSVCGITGPAAVGLGIAALKQIDSMPETFTGRRLAVAGIVTGAIGSLWMLFWVAVGFSA